MSEIKGAEVHSSLNQCYVTQIKTNDMMRNGEWGIGNRE